MGMGECVWSIFSNDMNDPFLQLHNIGTQGHDFSQSKQKNRHRFEYIFTFFVDMWRQFKWHNSSNVEVK